MSAKAVLLEGVGMRGGACRNRNKTERMAIYQLMMAKSRELLINYIQVIGRGCEHVGTMAVTNSVQIVVKICGCYVQIIRKLRENHV